jgi:DNA modification methylase
MTLAEIVRAIGVEPYHQEDAGVIYNCDCLEILPLIPDKSIDLVLTDPPYGVRKKEEWDDKNNFLLNIEIWLEELRKISPRIMWFASDNMLADILRNQYDLFRTLTWNKPIGSQYNGASHNNIWYSSEIILLFGEREKWVEKGKDSEWGYSVFNAPTVAQSTFGHPTTKPLKLMKELAKHHSDISDLILDPFLGSGTTAVAAKQLGRKFIGIEIEEKYCKIAVQRLAQGVLL